MRFLLALSIAALMSAGAVAAEPQATAAKPAVTDASLTTTPGDTNVDAQTVGHTHNHGACPTCGQHHHHNYVMVQKPKQSIFGRIMELERRKNRWLLSLIGR